MKIFTFKKNRNIGCKAVLLLVLYCLAVSASAQFTKGRLVVVQTSGTSTSASPLTLQEYGTDGTPGYSLVLPSSGSTPIQMSATSSGSEGFLTLSPDGTYLVLAGFSFAGTSSDVTSTSSSTTPRIISKVDFNGNYTLLYSNTTAYNGNDIRGAVTDGTNYWASGASSAGVDGIDYFGPNAFAALGTDASNPAKAYGLHIFNNQIYYSTQKAGPNNKKTSLGIFTIGSGLQTSGTATSTQIIGTGSATPEDFSFNPSMNVCYIAINASGVGIQKWTKTGSTWSLAYTLGTSVAGVGAFGLTVDYSGANPIIYATTLESDANRIIQITDTGSDASATTLATAPSGSWFHGICFAPFSTNPTPAQPAAFTASSTSVSIGQSGVVYTVPNDPAATSYTWTYRGTGATIHGTGNSVTIDFSGSATSGTLLVTANNAYGSSVARTMDITINNPIILGMDVVNTTDYLDGGATYSPASPYFISGVISDPTDPASTNGISFTANDLSSNSGNLSFTATSSNSSVVPASGLSLISNGPSCNLKINPVGVGYSTITVTASDGTYSASYIISYAASAASSTPGSTVWHTGISNASDAIALDDDYYMTADDEFDVINVYSRKNSGLPLVSYNYAAVSTNLNFNSSTSQEADVEAATSSVANPNVVYWMGSMSNSSSFNVMPNRDRIFATTYSGTGASTSFSFAGYCSLRSQIIAWGDANGYDFSSSAAAGSDPKTDNGFNAEGMVFAPDNTTLYIGLRAPLVPTANRKNAVIVPVLNFETWFNSGSATGSQANASFGSPIELDLGGRGIRDMIRLSNGTYVILAGSSGSNMTSAIYKWSGSGSDAPVLVNSSVNGVLNMEGVMPVNVNGTLSLTELQLISDNGDNDFYNDGTEAKSLSALNFQKFRSDIVSDIDLSASGTLGIASFSERGNITVVPNPAKDYIAIISSDDVQLTNVSIMNTIGEQVINKKSNSNEVTVSVGNLPSGIYFVVVTGSDRSKWTRRFVKM